ncbi:hypothetical protein D3C87_1475300 [compost metagenome]
MKRLMASDLSSGEVRAATIRKSAIGALVMYSLLPLSFQPPSTFSALVFMARMLEPPSGSLRAKPAILSPLSAGRKKRVFWLSVPIFQMGHMDRCVCADQLVANA